MYKGRDRGKQSEYLLFKCVLRTIAHCKTRGLSFVTAPVVGLGVVVVVVILKGTGLYGSVDHGLKGCGGKVVLGGRINGLAKDVL